ncbi:MAG: O-antigen ligase family protein [Lachnospiraceae bacterium]|nr:O-antigen ligase family protein [Lachnospiraceae bacterium]
MGKKRSVPIKKSRSFWDWLSLILLMLPLAVIPLIMYEHIYEPGYEGYAWFLEWVQHADFFLYYKHVVFIGVAAVMLLFLLIRAALDRRKLAWAPAFIPLAIYELLCVLSTVFSEYRSFGLSGAYEHFESLFVLLGYAVVVYYAYLFVKTESDLNVVLAVFSIGIFVITLLGAFQAFGKDLFATDFGKKLFLPESEWIYLDDYQITFEDGRTYMTLYNPNYVGVYTSLVIPVAFLLMLYAKPVILRFLNAANVVLALLCLYGSSSKAGLLGLGAIIILLVIFLRRRIVVTLLIIAVTVGGVYVLKDSPWMEMLISSMELVESNYNITDIQTADDEIAITYRGNTLHVQVTIQDGVFQSFTLTDDSGAEVAHTISEDGQTYSIKDERFPKFRLNPLDYNDSVVFRVVIDWRSWYFTNQEGDGTYYYITPYGRPDKIVNAEEDDYFGQYESFASRRGYLWSRTIPLLKDYIFLGSGADSFAQVFPQQDYLGKFNVNLHESVTTKPHSMYLQIGVQTGLISLAAFLLFYLMYAFQSIRLYIRGRFDSFAAQAGVGIFIGTVGYMLCGISNDSMLVVSPVFWTLLGLGFAANAMVKKQNAEKKAEKVRLAALQAEEEKESASNAAVPEDNSQSSSKKKTRSKR